MIDYNLLKKQLIDFYSPKLKTESYKEEVVVVVVVPLQVPGRVEQEMGTVLVPPSSTLPCTFRFCFPANFDHFQLRSSKMTEIFLN